MKFRFLHVGMSLSPSSLVGTYWLHIISIHKVGHYSRFLHAQGGKGAGVMSLESFDEFPI